MSQSDYLKYKRISNQLRIDNQKDAGATNQSAVFNSQDLLHYKEYSLTNTIVNTKPTLNKLTLNSRQRIYDMDKVVENCPTFIVCGDTSARPNRVAHTGRMCNDVPLNWREKKDLKNAKQLWCKCELNRSTTDGNRCACVKGV